MKMRTVNVLAGIMISGLVVGSFLFGGVRGAIDWRSLRAIAIESDDWGLAGFVPDSDAWNDIDRDELAPGFFPAAYWLTTLEDSSMVAALDRVLSAHTGRDGHSAVLQPNYVMSALAHAQGQWTRYDLPSLPPRYQRPGLWSAVAAGIARGTWYPEFHATWHYDPDLRKRDALGSEIARLATARDIMIFPGSERARELGPWRSGPELETELDHSMAVFRVLFGREVKSVMAPDYVWDDRMEAIWESRDILVIQGKREQINPAWGAGKPGRARKYLARQWSRLRHPARTYLERNCRLEPVQAPDPDAVWRTCARETQKAWQAGQPAIVESHRVNFAHTDPGLVEIGLDALDKYLGAVVDGSSGTPVFVTDHEIAQLYDRGTSWCVRGEVVVVRNATRGRKVVPIPSTALLRTSDGRSGHRTGKTVLVAVPAGSSIDLVRLQ